jgi:hypothetical protein
MIADRLKTWFPAAAEQRFWKIRPDNSDHGKTVLAK